MAEQGGALHEYFGPLNLNVRVKEMQIDWEGNATSSTETKRRERKRIQGQEKGKNSFTYNRSIWSKEDFIDIHILILSRILCFSI